MTTPLELSGKKFGRLSVICATTSENGRSMWYCRCVCGTHLIVRGTALTGDNSHSCGCLVRDQMAKVGRGNATHGKSRTSEYNSWGAMLRRCYDPDNNKFKYYGAAGIKVCKRWRDRFESFLADMGKRPSRRHTIDRYPNNRGNYEPKNCRWATYEQQNLNRDIRSKK